MRLSARALLTVVAVVLLAASAACGGNDRASTGRTQEAAGGSAALLLAQPQSERKVVYTAEVDVRVPAAAKAATDAVEETKRAGGHLFSQNSQDDSRTAELVLKVPGDRFEELLGKIEALGQVLRRAQKAQDVTAEVVDVEGRLKNAQASAERLRTLLGEAKNVADVVAVEGELTKRESEIESLQGRLRVLNDQIDLATITVLLTERDDLQVSDDLPSFFDAVRNGGVALANVGLATLVAVGFALPFTPFAALAVWLSRRWRRHHPKRPRISSAGPPAWPAPPTPPEPPSGS
jgi:hypothetical protein